MWLSTYVEVERYPHNRQQPQDLIKPSNVPMEPLLLRLGEWKEQPVKEVDRHQRDGVQHERLEYI